MDKKDARLLNKLTVLAGKQLASIDERLSNPGYVRWNEILFKIRHAKIRKILSDILARREQEEGGDAILGLINDLTCFGEGGNGWQKTAKKESDYLRFVLHGIKSAPEKHDSDGGK